MLLLLRNFIYVLLGNSATNKLTVEKIFLYTNIIYNIHIYNLGVDAHTRASSSNSRNACIRAYTCSRLIYFSGSSIHSLTFSFTFRTFAWSRSHLFSVCARYYLYILSCIDLSIRKWYVSALIRKLAYLVIFLALSPFILLSSFLRHYIL